MGDWNDIHAADGLKAVRMRMFAALDAYKADLAAAEKEAAGALAVGGAEAPARHWVARVDAATNNRKRSSLLGVQTVLANDPRWAGVLAYNEFAETLVKRKPPPWDGGAEGEWMDADTYQLVAWFGEHWRFEPSGDQLAGALSNVGRQALYHPVREWLAGLEWRNTQLLDVWLKEGLQAEDDPQYLALVGRAYLIGAIARVMQPGCKNDTVLILEGEQGRSKSTALLELFAPWSSDQPIVFGDRDTYLAVHGTWMLELAELDSWNKAEVTQSKAFFSQRRDRYRPPYAHRMIDVPRQTVFSATTNQFEYLKDPTGNRRYWPVRCGFADLDWLREHKGDLFAEALRAYQAGESWWATSDAQRGLISSEQDSRIQEDPWESAIMRYLAKGNATRWTTDELLYSALGLEAGHQQKMHQSRLAAIMRYLGYEKCRWAPSPGAARVRGYMRK